MEVMETTGIAGISGLDSTPILWVEISRPVVPAIGFDGGNDSVETRIHREREAYQHWWMLFREPDVWTDRQKRRAMYRARLAYQDASLATEFAITFAGNPGETERAG